MPHPYFVPVSPTFSLIAQSSGVSSSTSTLIVLPLIVRFAIAYPLLAQSIERAARAMVACKLELFKSRKRVSGTDES
jgi:hypothetical protein